MRILTVNVNTTESMTRSIAEAARAVVGADTEIIGVTPTFGAPSVEGNMESYLAATAVMDAVTHYDGEFDAVVLAGFGEHGKEGLMELLSVPVVDMTEAAAHVAMLLGSRFSVITTLDRAVPLIEDRLLSFGLDRRCAAVRSTGLGVLELEDAGHSVEVGVDVPGVGEVDMLVDDRLLVETDGYQFHSSKGDWSNDRRREQGLIAQGRLWVRLTYDDVMSGRTVPVVEAALNGLRRALSTAAV